MIFFMNNHNCVLTAYQDGKGVLMIFFINNHNSH